eukprot:GILK01005607.1.p1 GENE.GILK01005607.1~~GILK01005607.1.p1  ORF type:complete len:376 (+),score=51.87 GILK01005607.1:102-1130(+)
MQALLTLNVLLFCATLCAASLRGAPIPSHKEKVIIVADPGIDDAFAIMFALGEPSLDIQGIVINFGNSKDVHLMGGNALKLLFAANRLDIPVYLGNSVPIARKWTEHGGVEFHGANGLGNVELPSSPTAKVQSETGSEFLVRKVLEYRNQISLIVLSPLSTLAVAVNMDPSFVGSVKHVYYMGGSTNGRGNISPVAEANVGNDPDAAKVVFTAQWNITLAPLDVTMQTRMTHQYVENIGKLNVCGKILREVSQWYFAAYKRVENIDYIPVHDASAVMAMVHPEVYQGQAAFIDVETQGALTTGMTVADFQGRNGEALNTHVLLKSDNAAFNDLFMAAIGRLP